MKFVVLTVGVYAQLPSEPKMLVWESMLVRSEDAGPWRVDRSPAVGVALRAGSSVRLR
jgi:hypothetical protein